MNAWIAFNLINILVTQVSDAWKLLLADFILEREVIFTVSCQMFGTETWNK